MITSQLGTDSLLLAMKAVTTTASANFDTLGADYATIRVALASELTTDCVGPTISLLDCDTTVVTSFVTVVADRTTEDLTAAKVVTYHVDMSSGKRYLRLVVDPVGTAASDDAITLLAIGTLTRKVEAPSATAATVVVTAS